MWKQFIRGSGSRVGFVLVDENRSCFVEKNLDGRVCMLASLKFTTHACKKINVLPRKKIMLTKTKKNGV